LGKAFDVESFMLSPGEMKDMYPLMNVEDIYGGLFSPADGAMDPNGVCQALASLSKNRGGQIVEECEITGVILQPSISTDRPQIYAVDTSKGRIRCQALINCSGAWGNALCRRIAPSLALPLLAMKHSYVVTEALEGQQLADLPMVRDHDASICFRSLGDALYIGGYEQNPIFWKEVDDDPEFAFGLFDLDWGTFSAHVDNVVKRIPAIASAGIKDTVCGPESFTPDHKPLMGPDPRVKGLWHGLGFNSAGMMFSGGGGPQQAPWGVNGPPEIDMRGHDINNYNFKGKKEKKLIQ